MACHFFTRSMTNFFVNGESVMQKIVLRFLARIDWLKSDVSNHFYEQFRDDDYNHMPRLLISGKAVQFTLDLPPNEKNGTWSHVRSNHRSTTHSFKF